MPEAPARVAGAPGALPRQRDALAPRDISVKAIGRQGRRCGLAGLLLALLALPAAADDCIRLGSGFDFCPAGSDWAAAEWQSGGDVTEVILPDVFFWFTGEWAGRLTPKPGQVLPPAAAELTALLEWSHGDAPPSEYLLLQRDSFAVGGLEAERAIMRLALTEPPTPHLQATTLVSGPGGTRMMVAMRGNDSLGQAEIDRRSREIVALLRPRQEN